MSQLEKDKAFKLPRTANVLSGHFDAHNGDFDTPEEFIRAYLAHDLRAVQALSLQNMEQLRDVLKFMHPDIRLQMREETMSLEKMKALLDQLANKNRPTPAP